MEFLELLKHESLMFQMPNFAPDVVLRKLGMALVLGVCLSWIMRITHTKHQRNRTSRALLAMQYTHIFLCVSGAFVMIIIGNSLANAFGLTGALNMIRFRTNLIDPKDAAMIIVVISVGMACGVELFLPAMMLSLLCMILLLIMHAHSSWNEHKKESKITSHKETLEPIDS